jgi:hypothetical protein
MRAHKLMTTSLLRLFASGTRCNDARNFDCGSASGDLPAGPDVFAVNDGVPICVYAPVGQPARDWNLIWAHSPLAVEPGISYQSTYVEPLSKFAQ